MTILHIQLGESVTQDELPLPYDKQFDVSGSEQAASPTKEEQVTEDKDFSLDIKHEEGEQRQQWSNPIEFLLSCIALSVGLGNVWRFPITAYKNGGGAFLIPYLVVLIFIGRVRAALVSSVPDRIGIGIIYLLIS